MSPTYAVGSFVYDTAKAWMNDGEPPKTEINQDFAFYVNGSLNEETAKETVKMMGDAIDAKDAIR